MPGLEGWHRPDTACPYIESETFTQISEWLGSCGCNPGVGPRGPHGPSGLNILWYCCGGGTEAIPMCTMACPSFDATTRTVAASRCEVTQEPKHGLRYNHAFEVCDVIGARMCTADDIESERCGKIQPCPSTPDHIKVWTFTPAL